MTSVDLNPSTTNNRGTWCKWNYEYNNVKTSTNIVKIYIYIYIYIYIIIYIIYIVNIINIWW